NLSDPIISMTHFFMSQPTFPPHPHAGFSAITYMLEHSKNGFLNRDSLGDSSSINPGDLHWTMAGRGMMHEEVPQTNGIAAEGLQIFINLKKKNKHIDPRAMHVSGKEAAVYKDNGLQVKVLSGAYENAVSKVHSPEPVQILDVQLFGTTQFSFQKQQAGLIYVYEGELELQGADVVPNFQTIAFRNDGDVLKVKMQSQKQTRFVLLSGEPTNEPLMARGPFIMNDMEALRDAEMRFRSGEMGRLV
ncbi:pirin family protein, partial [bacterium]|nr:pirin family protein [bacterium]